MYSSFSGTLSLSLFILLVLGSCACQTPQSFLDLVLSPRCLSNRTDVWWKPLEWEGQDPCALSHHLLQQNNATAHIGCCSVQSGMSSHTRRRRRSQTPHCGPCNLQTYNIAAACLACAQPSTLTASTAVVQSEIANKSLALPTSQQWSAGQDHPSDLRLSLLPPWVFVSPDTNDNFDVTRVVQNATASSPLSTSSSPASPSISLSQATFVTSVSPASSPSSSAAVMSAQQLSSDKNAGVIAGGVLGGTILLALVALAVLLIRRRRSMQHVAPSAEFMPVLGPRAGYMTSQDASPPPFSPGMWRDPVLEKVHSTST